MKITTVVLENSDGVSIKLTIDEARKLHKELDKLFSDSVAIPYLSKRANCQ